LVAKFLREFAFESNGRLIVNRLLRADQTEALTKFLLRQALHFHKQAALMICATWPRLDTGINLPPSPQIKIPDAKIRTLGNKECLRQR
jgi:hypothetical protein